MVVEVFGFNALFGAEELLEVWVEDPKEEVLFGVVDLVFDAEGGRGGVAAAPAELLMVLLDEYDEVREDGGFGRVADTSAWEVEEGEEVTEGDEVRRLTVKLVLRKLSARDRGQAGYHYARFMDKSLDRTEGRTRVPKG